MASQLPMRLSGILFAAALIASPAYAQGRGGGGVRGGGGGMRGGHGGYTIRVGHPSGRGGFRNRGGYGGYFLPPYWWPDDGYEQPPSPPPQQPPVQVNVEKPAPPPAPPAPPVESLMLEYVDGKWVRVPTGEQTPNGTLTVQPGTSGQAPAPVAAGKRAEPAPPAPPPPNPVLVFRDGRKEVVRRYLIKGGFIYVRRNYWETGSPAKKIALSELNVPATIELNKQRGAKFELPGGPDEIVVGL